MRVALFSRSSQLLGLVLLLGSLPLMTGLDACLGVCDPETDPTCEDITRAQVSGTITVPEAGGEMTGFVRVDDELARTLKDAMAREVLEAHRADGTPVKHRYPRASRRNEVAHPKSHVAQFRDGELVVKAREPVRDRKAEFGRQLELELSARFGRTIDVDVRLCGTPFRCLADLRDEHGKPLDASDTAEAVAVVAGLPFVQYAEKNLILQMTAQPNDEYFTLQWHYAALDLPAAWDITVGDPSLVAAVVDTGIILDHPDLRTRIVGPGADLIDDSGVANDGDGRDDDGDDPGDKACGADCHSFHGSHVAGTIGAETDDGDLVAGVSWEGGLLPVRVLGAGGGSLADIADGIEWAVGHTVDGVRTNGTPADVINMSLGGYGESEVMNDAIASAVAEGCIVIVAAGNDDTNAEEFTPANAPAAITVAAHGNTGPDRAVPAKASYSNYGATVDVAAPGGEQAVDEDGDGQPDGVLSTVDDYVTFYQGTSMAAPHVAGIAMLLKSIDRNVDQEEVRQLLKDTSNPQLDCPDGCGAGRVSAATALLALQGGLDGVRVIASPSFVRVGLGQREAPLVFKNIGNAAGDVSLRVGGADREKCSLSSNQGRVDSQGLIGTSVTLERNDAADDVGECTVTATWDGGSTEARVVWSSDVVAAVQTVDVGAVRLGSDGSLRVARIVATSKLEGFQYKLFNLEPGTYLIIGLVDTNANGSYDDPEDAIGIYEPRRQADGSACNQATCGRVTLGTAEQLSGADFVVAPGFSGGDDDTGGTGDGVLGDGCSTSSDCSGGLYCELVLTNGYCTTDCVSSADCPDAGLCASLVDVNGEEYSVCLATCSVDADCREAEGYFCDPADSTCFPS